MKSRFSTYSGARPPSALMFAVGLIAATMLLVEIVVTRVFSVLFFYHYSSFAIALIMSGLAFGGLLAARWDTRAQSDDAFRRLLARLAGFSAGALVVAVLVVLMQPVQGLDSVPSLLRVAVLALVFLPGLTAAGAFLAAAFARRVAWIGRLYAADLICAALACFGAIGVMRTVQGPAGLLAPALLAALAGLLLAPARDPLRRVCGLILVIALGGMLANVSTQGRLLRLRTADEPAFERWNEHSRIMVYEQPDVARFILIDKTAGTYSPLSGPRLPGHATPRPPASRIADAAYHLGRPLDQVAIIGFGGGMDALAPVAAGAKHIDGYELNGIILDIHAEDRRRNRGVAAWPEISLIHSEGRVGIAHAGKKYDVIQASMIDTWAATASGGFVLSENGLYTLQGWQVFLSALSERGLLTMTRWYLPYSPAEAHRLVSLAALALAADGIADPSGHIILVAGGKAVAPGEAPPLEERMATILVSKAPFSPADLEAVRKLTVEGDMHLLVAPGFESTDAVFDRILDPATRAQTIVENPFDISAPTDMRPYFFLMLRPGDVLASLGEATDNGPLQITLNGTRVMLILVVCSLIFAVGVLIAAKTTLPAADPSPAARRIYGWSTLYFLGIGLGYICIQLGLHQRLILILGHPTLALSVVLFFMLLGTGLGSACSVRLFPEPRSFWKAWLMIVGFLVLLIGAVPLLPLMEQLDTSAQRIAGSGLLLLATGFVLGFGFPLGVRLVAPAGEWGVQKMWAVNGAATIAGSALASILGLALGSRAVLGAGLVFYLGAMLAGLFCRRVNRAAPPPDPAGQAWG